MVRGAPWMTEERYLIPVLADDALLFAVDDLSDDENDEQKLVAAGPVHMLMAVSGSPLSRFSFRAFHSDNASC